MEPWQLHRLVENDDESGKFKRQLGGAIIALKVVSTTGPLDEIEVRPVEVDILKLDSWQGQLVYLKVADKLVWFEAEEVQVLIQLLQVALKAAEENVIAAGQE